MALIRVRCLFEAWYLLEEIWYINSLRISNFDIDRIKAKLRDSAFSPYQETSKSMENNLAKAECDALKSLIRNKKLILQKADQGSTVIPLHRKDYISKCRIGLQQHSPTRND